MARNRTRTFTLTGGEDRVSAPYDIPDGMARIAHNFEQNYNTGYTRVSGYRDLVSGIVPGEGKILGTLIYNDNIYIFRNKTGGATAGMWRAIPDVYDDTETTIVTPGSWIEITSIEDSNGLATTLLPDGYYEFVIHNFKATAKDFGNYRGDWSATTDYVEGDIINDSAGVLGVANLKYITHADHKSSGSLSSDSSFWSLINWSADTAPSDAHNISGSSGNVYGVDGKNPAFEFDGTTLKQIDSTYTNDTPNHIEANGNRLVLGFRSGEIAISVLGFPFNFDPIYGAGSIGISDFLTGLVAGPDGVLYIFAKDKIYLLYNMGGPLDQSELKKHSKAVGAYPYTAMMLGKHALFFDTWGLTEIQVTQEFGDVVTNSLSEKVQPIINQKQPIKSVVLKERAQHRTYFTEAGGTLSTTCIVATLIQGEKIGVTSLSYPFSISTADSGLIGLEEYNVLGTTDGSVYRMDIGNSFNGAAYRSILSLPFNYLGSPSKIKKFKKVKLSVDSPDAVDFLGTVEFNPNSSKVPSDPVDSASEAKGIKWDDGNWGSFSWGGSTFSYIEQYANGHGDLVATTVQVESDSIRAFTLKDITYIYEYMRVEH